MPVKIYVLHIASHIRLFWFSHFLWDRALDYLHRNHEKYHNNKGLDPTQMKGYILHTLTCSYTEINTWEAQWNIPDEMCLKSQEFPDDLQSICKPSFQHITNHSCPRRPLLLSNPHSQLSLYAGHGTRHIPVIYNPETKFIYFNRYKQIWTNGSGRWVLAF